MTNKEASEKVLEGYRLDCPKLCPQDIYAIMLDCWIEKPAERPEMKNISEKISPIIIAENHQILKQPASESEYGLCV